MKSLGIRVEKYFAIVFIIGSALAALGGVLYAPLSTLHPYMGFDILVLCFAVVIVRWNGKAERDGAGRLWPGFGNGYYRKILGAGIRCDGLRRDGYHPLFRPIET